MRASAFVMALAVLFECMVPAPSRAATIVQTSTNSDAVQGSFQGFDPSLGTLTSVTLEILARGNRLPNISESLQPVSWNTSGDVLFELYIRTNGSLNDYLFVDTFHVPITGSGVIDWSTGQSEMFITGSGTFSIDPSLIPSSADYNGSDVTFIRDRDLGFLDFSDTMFTPDVGSPENFYWNSEASHHHLYTLTYTYGAVPDPGTWAMSLLGFASVGLAIRRGRKQSRRSSLAATCVWRLQSVLRSRASHFQHTQAIGPKFARATRSS